MKCRGRDGGCVAWGVRCDKKQTEKKRDNNKEIHTVKENITSHGQVEGARLEGYKFFAVVGDWWLEQTIGFKQPFPAWFARQTKLDIRGRMANSGLVPGHITRSCNYKGGEKLPRWGPLERLPEDVVSALGLMWLCRELAQWKAADATTRQQQAAFLDELLACVGVAITVSLLPGAEMRCVRSQREGADSSMGWRGQRGVS